MNRNLNSTSQPLHEMPVFNNWDVVALGWYLAASAKSVGPAGVLAVELCGQRLVLFRGDDGVVRARDAICPHMGADLARGDVEGNTLRCALHRKCLEVEYATEEKWGFIWVYPSSEAPSAIVEFPGWEGEEVVAQAGIPFERPCHHHVSMINGIDPQHLRTVHDIHIDMELIIDEGTGNRVVDYTLRGAIPETSFRERLGRRLLGETYQYSMRYADGNIGLLSVNEGTRLLGTGPELPSTHMVFAYVPLESGRTLVQPIYVAKRRTGIVGRLFSHALLIAMKWGFYVLRDEDGEIYDHIRFRPANLLPIDAPVSKYIAYVNRLEPSAWSRSCSTD